MLDPALVTLLRLRGRGLVRRLIRGLRRPSGVAFALFGVLVFGLWAVPLLVGVATGERVPAEPVRRFGPAIIALVVLSNMLSRSAQHTTSFTPAEIDALFPAPFTRRQLVAYKVTLVLASAMGIGTFLSFMLLPLASTWLFGLVAVVLALLLVNLVGMAALLGGRYVALLLRTTAERLAAAAVVVVAVGGVALTIPIDRGAGPWEQLQAVLDSPVVSAALAPFGVFTAMLTAESWGVFGAAAAAAALMCLGLVALIVRLDAGAVEATLERAARLHAQAERARRRSGIHVAYGGWSARLRVPPLPWLSGAGPIVHRQLTTALRSLPSLVVNFGVPFAIITAAMAAAGRYASDAAVYPLAMGLVLFTLILPSVLLFDFRGDLDQMDWIKMLPVRPAPMVVGQLVAPVVGLTLAQGLLLALAALVGAAPVALLAAVALVALPFNFLNLAIENATFLAYPTRKLAVGLSDLAGFGRQMLLFVAKAILLGTACGAALLAGWLASLPAGGSRVLFVAAAWVVLAAAAASAVPVVAVLFDRFDVSRDTPG